MGPMALKENISNGALPHRQGNRSMLHRTETLTQNGAVAKRFAKHTRDIRIVLTKFENGGDLISLPSFRAQAFELEIDMAGHAKAIAAAQGRSYVALIENDTVIDVARPLSAWEVSELRTHGGKKFTSRALLQSKA